VGGEADDEPVGWIVPFLLLAARRETAMNE